MKFVYPWMLVLVALVPVAGAFWTWQRARTERRLDGLVARSLRARRDARLKMLRQANRGQGVARNRGLECAHGEFVQFVDADDALAVPDALERLLATMRRERLDTLFFDAQTHVCSESLCGQPLPIRAEDYVRRGDYSAVSSGPDLFAAFLKNREYSPSPSLM